MRVCHLCSYEGWLGEGQDTQGKCPPSGFYNSICVRIGRGSGESSSEGGPNSGPTVFLQLHCTGIQPLPTIPGPQRPSALREPLPQHPSQGLKESLLNKEAWTRGLQPTPPLTPPLFQTVGPEAQHAECLGGMDQGQPCSATM